MKIMCLVSAILLLAVPVAWADLAPFGDPQPAGSWYQEWQSSAGFQFDLFAIRIMTDGAVFADDADPLSNFDGSPLSSGWSFAGQGRDKEGKPVAAAHGVSTNSKNFQSNHEGDLPKNPQHFEIEFAAFGSHGEKESKKATYDYDYEKEKWGWKVVNGGFENEDGDKKGVEHTCGLVVPVPPAVLLGALGLGLVGWVKRRLA